ncbi:MAG: serine hydrolase [Acidobacteriota bacterium]|nr:MAG: serine hydrolase [Acidobacteriota bacterium]
MRVPSLITLLCLFVLSVSVSAGAEPNPNAATDHLHVQQAIRLYEAWVESEMAYKKIPGASLGLIHDQELVWSHGFGYADREQQVEETDETVHSICSISKLFTSLAIMQLRDAGKLRLDDRVSDHLPYSNLPPTDSDDPSPTIRGLLTHSAGLPRESAQSYWTEPDFPFPTRGEVIEGLSGQKMLYPPERYFQYSNLGMTLLGQIIEKASGESYDDYVAQNILKPLDLKNTTPFLPEQGPGSLMAQGYGRLTREGARDPINFFQARGIAPAAGYGSNVQDLAAFASWQFRLLSDEGSETLKSSTLREMQRVQWMDMNWKNSWGLGFEVYRVDEDTFVGHGGYCPGFRSVFLLIPKRKLSAIVMFNAMDLNPKLFAGQMIKTIGKKVEEALESQEKPALPPIDLEPYAGVYESAWWEEVIVPWEDGLASFHTPTDDPLSNLTRLKHIEGDTFRRFRDDDESLGEEWIFERDDTGKVIRVKVHGNYRFRQ